MEDKGIVSYTRETTRISAQDTLGHYDLVVEYPVDKYDESYFVKFVSNDSYKHFAGAQLNRVNLNGIFTRDQIELLADIFGNLADGTPITKPSDPIGDLLKRVDK